MGGISDALAGAGVLVIAASFVLGLAADLLRGPDGEGAAYIFACTPAGGAARYRFRIVREEPGYRAYILEAPDYGGRPDDFHTTHRMQGGRGAYVCWDRPVPGCREAERVAGLWADMTQRYIDTGEPF